MEMLMFLHVFALKQGLREDNGLATGTEIISFGARRTVQNRNWQIHFIGLMYAYVKNFVVQTGKTILEIFMDYKYAFYCLSWSAELIKLHYLCV